MAYEEAYYKVVLKTDNFEVRLYDERVVVQTKYHSNSSGFQKLFNYISGQNQDSEKIEMTTPVTMLQQNNQMVMQFFLPSRFNVGSAPLPLDRSVEIAKIDKGYFAVIKYSGFASDKNFIKHAQILKSKLIENKINFQDQPIKATYDGPFTLPNFRRNEAMYLIRWD
tara:strand:+ start:107 stop:607 length:501 start_codon:yes stop_codon:yes gene_type:complete